MTDQPKTPENNEAPKEVLKDKPRPISIFRHESAKTSAVQQTAAAERQVVDEKFNIANGAYAPALADYEKKLKEAATERLAVRKETVDNLTKEVGTMENSVAALEKQLEEARSKLWLTQDKQRAASKDLGNETAVIAKEQKTARKIKVAELSKNVKDAKKERSAVYSKTGKQLRREHWNTFKNTTKESIAFIPDMTARVINATRHGLSEVFSVFSKSAKKAGEGFNKPTPFSITREEPLPGQQPPKAPEAPKAL